MDKSVSIIVIAHSNDRTLHKCLLSASIAARDDDQKILVLNRPTKSVIDIANKFSSNWIIIREDNLVGPQHARNAGALVATRPYLVFLDDDISISRKWIELMLNQFTEPTVAIAQGHIKFEKNDALFWNYLRYRNLGYFQKMRAMKPNRMCDTAAIVVKKRWFEAVQGFSRDLRIGEDSFFAMKVTICGGAIKFNSSVSVDQIFDKEENFFKYIKLGRLNALYILKLYLKTNRPNHIDIHKFVLRKNKGCVLPISYLIIHFLITLSFNISFNPYRLEMCSGNRILKTRNSKLSKFD